MVYYSASNEFLLVNKLKEYLTFNDKLDFIKSILNSFKILGNLGVTHNNIDSESIFIYNQIKIINKGFYTYNSDFTKDIHDLAKLILEILINRHFDINQSEDFHIFMGSNYNITHSFSVQIYKTLCLMIRGQLLDYSHIINNFNNLYDQHYRLSTKIEGRDDDYRKLLEASIKGYSCLMIKGDKGVGKTSFIFSSLKKLKKQGYIPVIIDCKKYKNKSLKQLLSHIIDLLIYITRDKQNYENKNLEIFSSVLYRPLDDCEHMSFSDIISYIEDVLPNNILYKLDPVIFISNSFCLSNKKLEFIVKVLKSLSFNKGLVILEDNNLYPSAFIENSIELLPLPITDYAKIIRNSLKISDEDLIYITNILYKNTYGNPLFLKELFIELQLKSILWFNPLLELMVISKSRIHSIGVTNSQVTNTLEKLNYFTKSQMNILKLAFAQGEIFSLKILKNSSKLENNDLIEIIKFLIKNRIIYFEKGIYSEHYWQELTSGSVDAFFRFSNKSLYKYIGSLFTNSIEVYNFCYYICILNINMVKDLETNNILYRCLAKSWFLIDKKHMDIYINNFNYLYNYYLNCKNYAKCLSILRVLKKIVSKYVTDTNKFLYFDVYLNLIKVSYICSNYTLVEKVFDGLYDSVNKLESLFPVIHYYLKSLLILGKEKKAYNKSIDFYCKISNSKQLFNKKPFKKFEFIFNIINLLFFKKKYLIRSCNISTRNQSIADFLLNDFILVLNIYNKENILFITNKVLSMYRKGGDGSSLAHSISIYGLYISSFLRKYKYIRIFNKLSKRILSRKENTKKKLLIILNP
jgi:hypothetical protein